MPTLNVDGRDLYYEPRGDGDPLLLIQGLSGNHLAWGDRFLRALAPHRLVITYDHRGIGHSQGGDEPFTIADLAADAAGLLTALGIERADVMGISMGGMVAQELALARPEVVRTLTLGCTYAGGEGSALTDQVVIERLVTSVLSGDRELALRTGWEANTSAAFAALPGNFDEFRAMATQLPAPATVLMAQMQAAMGHNASERLQALTMPVLVIHGDEDQILDVANGRQIAGLIDGARLEVFEGTGHLLWWERPHETAELVLAHTAVEPLTAG